MQIIRAQSLEQSPWRTGNGQTTQIAVWPPSASLENFEWRISTAEIEVDGPFSAFPGIDRSFILISGSVKLKFADRPTRVIAPGSKPYGFPGEVPTTAELWGGPALALNVMVRRGHWRCNIDAQRKSFRVAALPGTARYPRCAVVVANGLATVTSASATHELALLDTVIIDPTTDHMDVTLSSDGLAYLVMIEAV
jgi:uncharacterized protein